QWQIPAGISIPAGGYCLFWADGTEEQGITHTNFKLSKGGEAIGLFDIDGVTLLDSIEFGEQETDISYARYPDGSDNWVFCSQPTPGATNSEPVQDPAPNITANGSNAAITISTGESLQISVSLDCGERAGEDADWWIVVSTSLGWFYFDVSSGLWRSGIVSTYQGGLFELGTFNVLDIQTLPAGEYEFFFGVDLLPNDSVDFESIYFDSVQVTVTE
ncbi:MAG: hypothetical protein JW941_06770, partial [Candidatus Coatesbacteria bacterium]|nr:hypothetical protein [Candidatus Coatesbacteria bacterium]